MVVEDHQKTEGRLPCPTVGAGGGKTEALTSHCGSDFDILKYCKDPRTKVCKERKHKGSQTILSITSTTIL